jgi:hypothetical protein
MLIEQVKKLTPLERALYFITERQAVYEKKIKGIKPPWSDDEILQQFYFCNVYREQDKTTRWFRELVREPRRDHPNVLMATVIFRWFNKIETGQMFLREGLYDTWLENHAVLRLKELNKKQPVFTSAYMIKCGNGPPGCKIPMVCSAISQVWKCQQVLIDKCLESNSLEESWETFCQFRGLGPFMSYEIITDLNYTYLLENATDVDTWANPGPGAKRGLSWLRYGDALHHVLDPIYWMQHYLEMFSSALPRMPMNMRFIEHCLCEIDKYNRALFGTGRMKRRYPGMGDTQSGGYSGIQTPKVQRLSVLPKGHNGPGRAKGGTGEEMLPPYSSWTEGIRRRKR